MISNSGNGIISGYTVYKTDTSGMVNIDMPAVDSHLGPQTAMDKKRAASAAGDSFQPSLRLQRKEKTSSRGDDDLQGIRQILEEINAKLSALPEFRNRSLPIPNQAWGNREQERGLTPQEIHPLMRNDIPAYGQHYDLKRSLDYDPGAAKHDDGYDRLQACKNVNSWAKIDYAQTEGLDTVYSPQELRDRIAVLDEIQNTIKNCGDSGAPSRKPSPYSGRTMIFLRAQEKDPERADRWSSFESMI